jgi:hypothetical protein
MCGINDEGSRISLEGCAVRETKTEGDEREEKQTKKKLALYIIMVSQYRKADSCIQYVPHQSQADSFSEIFGEKCCVLGRFY